jgi:hypothetical protein
MTFRVLCEHHNSGLSPMSSRRSTVGATAVGGPHDVVDFGMPNVIATAPHTAVPPQRGQARSAALTAIAIETVADTACAREP